jgi:hypothetical protein
VTRRPVEGKKRRRRRSGQKDDDVESDSESEQGVEKRYSLRNILISGFAERASRNKCRFVTNCRRGQGKTAKDAESEYSGDSDDDDDNDQGDGPQRRRYRLHVERLISRRSKQGLSRKSDDFRTGIPYAPVNHR